jgi:hypothetical protein
MHLPQMAMSVPGSASPYARDLADMMTLFLQAGYATDPFVLRGTFGINGLPVEEWAGGVR